MVELPKVYDPKEVEEKWYRFWLDKKYFHAIIDRSKKPFCIVIPPPNVTGSLHMGHALNNVLQDIVIRQKRMEGYMALWLPGTDHAGIATQNVVEQQLGSEGLTRQDLGREKFIERVWQWKEKYGSTIINQLKRLGASCDWDRERFTMDEGCSRAVNTVFIRLYQEGLIYRGNYIINWCPRCHTALSDIEVEHQDIQGNLWYVKYPLKDSSGFITVATTRPETMLGDTAVAVHPEDKRYQRLVGKVAILPILKRELPIIADDYVDKEFGTGAVKVTPAHDPNDFEIGLRHGLLQINVLTPDGKINENGEKYQGLDRFEARRALVNDLEREGLIEKIGDHLHAIGHCYRCNTIVEPYLSLQWFVKMKPLAEPAIKAVEDRRVRFVPERWAKVYFEWMHNIRDWCISRQIWWGHRIPVWYCEKCGETIVQAEEPVSCPKCPGQKPVQDTDVLDTWFSSALWPFSTLGWPDETDDLKYFYSTSLLSTGFDIIFFWVARMIMMGLHFPQDVPFRKVYIHALIRDAEGRKMSKSAGNVIDPLDTIDKYGTDALRFTLASLAVPGRDVFLSEERIEGYRNFCNKIWNASRFVLMNLEGHDPRKVEEGDFVFTLADRWIRSRYARLVSEVNRHLSTYNFSEASRALYNFFWGEYCDWYIEMCKPRLYGDDKVQRETAQHLLASILEMSLRLLHPFTPFITEEIWQKLPGHQESIMVSSWPEVKDEWIDSELEGQMEILQDAIYDIRHLRSEYRVPPGKQVSTVIRVPSPEDLEVLKAHESDIRQLASVGDLRMGPDEVKPKSSAAAVRGQLEVFLPLVGLIDFESERKRLSQELAKVEKELSRVEGNLADKTFLSKAPEQVVDKKREIKEDLQLRKHKLEEQLKSIE